MNSVPIPQSRIYTIKLCSFALLGILFNKPLATIKVYVHIRGDPA